MLRRILLALVSVTPAIAACGGVVETSPPKGDGGVRMLPRGDAGRDVAVRDTAEPRDVGTEELSPYHDPGCPDADTLPVTRECDPFAPPPGSCQPGEGCTPFVNYPDDPCGKPQYGTVCVVGGGGGQGAPCGGGNECAAGFVCVESREGSQCVQICDPNRFGSCSDGRVCDTLDVPGFGGCL